MQSAEETLSFEEHDINRAIREVQGLLAQAKSGSRTEEFYYTIEQTMIACSGALAEAQATRRSYDNLCKRVRIMESLINILLDRMENGSS